MFFSLFWCLILTGSSITSRPSSLTPRKTKAQRVNSFEDLFSSNNSARYTSVPIQPTHSQQYNGDQEKNAMSIGSSYYGINHSDSFMPGGNSRYTNDVELEGSYGFYPLLSNDASCSSDFACGHQQDHRHASYNTVDDTEMAEVDEDQDMTDHAPVEEKYVSIYKHYTGCEGRKVRQRLNSKMTDDLKRMLDSQNDEEIRKACHILSCRYPDDLFNIDETRKLITKIHNQFGIDRKQASAIVRFGSIGFPENKKADLLDLDGDEFMTAYRAMVQLYQINYREYGKIYRRQHPRDRRKIKLQVTKADAVKDMEGFKERSK